MPSSTRLVVWGSSPLARGPHTIPTRNLSRRGLIPARAGTTRNRARSRPMRWAHPRSRGDHYEPAGIVHRDEGSSPLARGPLPRGVSGFPFAGLIPARAGTTPTRQKTHHGIGAHPRSRGDHLYRPAVYRGLGGSSPLARGPRSEGPSRSTEAGLIPARAGTTAMQLGNSQTARAHPRSRGDHMLEATPEPGYVGSSPLARGPQRCRSPSATR